MLKKIVFGLCIPLAILGAAALSFSGCGKSAPASDSAGKMKVVATTTMLTDLARQIGGDKVEVSGLMKAGVDPHLYQAGAGDVDAMNKADIVVYNGVHLEGKMGAIFDNLHAQKKPTIRVSDGIPSETLLDFEEDGEKTKDPHIWFSVKNWKAAAKEVAKGFSEKDPKNKSYYEDHLNAYLAELDNLDKYIRKEVELSQKIPVSSSPPMTLLLISPEITDLRLKASRESALPAKQALPTSARWPLSLRIIKSKRSSWNLPSPIKPSSLSRLLSKHGASMFPSAANCTPTLLAASPRKRALISACTSTT